MTKVGTRTRAQTCGTGRSRHQRRHRVSIRRESGQMGVKEGQGRTSPQPEAKSSGDPCKQVRRSDGGYSVTQAPSSFWNRASNDGPEMVIHIRMPTRNGRMFSRND